MVAGFDRYFQIAPCFRDEDARADRSPGEFYQLDMEMSFVEQEDVFAVIEPVVHGVFEEFTDWEIAPPPFPRIPFAEAMLKYGTDKPDLRNPLEIGDCAEAFRGGGFGLFARAIDKGAVVRAIPAPGVGDRPRSFFDKLNGWARDEGWPGLGYIVFGDGGGRGPIANNLEPDRVERIRSIMGAADGDAVFFACDRPDRATRARRPRADPVGGGARAFGTERVPVLLDRGLSDVRMGRDRTQDRVQPQTPSPCPRGGWRPSIPETPWTS